MKPCVTLTLIGLLAIAAFPPSAAFGLSQPAADTAPRAAGGVVLVAGKVIDLAWDPAQYPDPKGQPFRRWELRRGTARYETSPVATDSTGGFFRDDQDLAPDTTYYYELYVVRWNAAEQKEEFYLVFRTETTTGGFRGTLHRDLTLAPGEFSGATSDVEVLAGVTLAIGSKTTIIGGGAHTNGGRIQIDGATLKYFYITFGAPGDATSSGAGWVRKAKLDSGYIAIYGRTENLPVNGNVGEFGGVMVAGGASAIIEKNRGFSSLSVGDGSSAVIRNNPVISGTLNVGGAGAKATVRGNKFLNESCRTTVRVSGGATATIVDNTIEATGSCDYHMGIVAEGGATVTASYNRLQYVDRVDEVDYCATCHMLTARDGGRLTAEHNDVTNGALAVYGGATIQASGNVIRDGWVRIGDPLKEASSAATGRIEGNTIQDGGGFMVAGGAPFPGLAIKHNCIQGDGVGLQILDSTPITVIDNWWGHETGPKHPTQNPGGLGRYIDGNTAIFEPWDRLPTYCLIEPQPLVDLRVAGMEVVQVIQDEINSVHLVADRPTAVRVFAEYKGGGTAKVKGELKGYRDGKLLSPPKVLVGSISAGELSSPDDWERVKRNKGSALTFRLPEEWLSGTVTMKVALRLEPAQEEWSLDNNADEITAMFYDQRRLTIGLVPIKYQPDGADQPKTPALDKLPSLVDFMRKTFPHAKVEPKQLATLDWTTKMTGLTLREVADRGKELRRKLAIEYRGQANQIVGVFSSSVFLPKCQSSPLWLGGTAVASFCDEDGQSIAHEVGHNLGLYHPCREANKALCGGAFHEPPPEPDWPYQDPSIQEVGINLRATDFGIVQSYNKDFMTQGFLTVWISPHHYEKLFKANGVPRAAAATQQSQALGEQTYLWMSGWVHSDGSVSFLPFWQVTASEPPANPLEGSEYCLELRDAGEAVLQSRCFDLSFYDGEVMVETEKDLFLVALPLAAGTARVVLRQGSTELGRMVASDHEPAVTLLAPNGGGSLEGSTEVRWSADDQDGDALFYSISYSIDDGASWLPVAFEITGTTTYTLDLAELPGGTACRVRVEASDGFHNASDESDGAFGVPDKDPTAYIHLPEDGGTVVTPVNLIGYGYDLEDGALEGSALAWTSDLDGPLGTGEPLWDANLSPGQHTLTLTVTDSQAQTGSDSITLTVVEGYPLFLPAILRSAP